MTVAVYWPDTLPPPLAEGYGIAPRPSLLRTEMETGAARHRLRSRTVLYQVGAQLRLSQEAFAVFDAWWAQLTAMGQAWFAMPLATPLGVSAVEARLTAPWEANYLPAGFWTINLQIECRDIARLTPEELDAASQFGADSAQLAARLNTWLNNHLSAPDYW